ncbi:MAG: DUF4112 domain-containing protein [Pseudohongiellaceae bacterium]
MNTALASSRRDAATETPSARARSRVHRIAWLMDRSVRLPGGFRIGVDGLVGLVPVVGDFAGAGASFYIVTQAARAGVSRGVLARMVLNVGLDAVVGSIPLLGDVFDVAFKANMRNARLMDRYLDKNTPPDSADKSVLTVP